jgi:hypothetical protein
MNNAPEHMRTLITFFGHIHAQILMTFCFVLFAWCILPHTTMAATLRLTPGTGVYTTGGSFTVSVIVDSTGKSINAAEGTLSFDPDQLTVTSASRGNSIFSLWVTEPSFSNSAGTVSFSGGSPAGYSGSAGTVMSVTFRAKTAGTARLTLSQGAVLANDGKGTNVLTNMSSGSYTIGAQNTTPQAEVIAYVPPANTPSAPIITSSTHEDPASWYREKNATLSWSLPSGVTAVRTLLDNRPSSVPTRVYEDPITTITLPDLPDGVSYFHLQFQNADGWGAVSHYRLAIDTERPADFTIATPDDVDRGNPEQVIFVTATDTTSGIARYQIKIDNNDSFSYVDEERDGRLRLPALLHGYHTVIIEAFDAAGNGTVASHSFTIEAFTPPVFLDYPPELGEGIIPVIMGETRPSSTVEVTVARVGSEPMRYEVMSDESGRFIFIPSGSFSSGVYELTARATDGRGAQSEVSSGIRIAVQQPGLVRIGSFLVNVISVMLSLIALIVVSIVGSWYLIAYMRRLRRRVSVESKEALAMLRREFSTLRGTIASHEAALGESRKGGKMTKAESDMVAAVLLALQDAEARVEKEISDVDRLVRGHGDGSLRK